MLQYNSFVNVIISEMKRIHVYPMRCLLLLAFESTFNPLSSLADDVLHRHSYARTMPKSITTVVV